MYTFYLLHYTHLGDHNVLIALFKMNTKKVKPKVELGDVEYVMVRGVFQCEQSTLAHMGSNLNTRLTLSVAYILVIICPVRGFVVTVKQMRYLKGLRSGDVI